ncbi:MAG: hypothetical protein QXW94_05025, partial [Desulfurococcaceae archaeon]
FNPLGQGDLLAALILIGVTIVVGIGFLSLVYPSVSGLVGQNDLRTLLYNEQSVLVVYKEYENSTHTCIGIIRLEPEKTRYSLALIADERIDVLARDINAISFPLSQSSTPEPSGVRTITADRAYRIISGEHCPCFKGLSYLKVVYLPQDVADNYLSRGIPALTCLSKDIIRQYGIDVTLYVFVQVNTDFYEVGEVNFSVEE